MNEKEVAELRRRFRPDRSGVSHVRGCYVNENREIVSQFDQPLGVMTQEENEKLLTLLKRTLSGTLEKNLLDITFATQQVVHGAEHKRLMDLRASELKDEEAVQSLFQAIIGSVAFEGNYVILLAHDAYDVPYRGGAGGCLRPGVLVHPVQHLSGEAHQTGPELPRSGGGVPHPGGGLGGGPTGAGLSVSRL